MVSITSPGGVGSLRGMGKLGNGGCVAGLTGGCGFPGGGEKRLFRTLPETMRTRCSAADRLARLQENGGTPACENAVIKSLRWFKGTQNTNGSYEQSNQAAMTGSVLLSYFDRSESPVSEEFGDSCTRGIVYLVNLGLKNQGKFSNHLTANHWSYEHAIATYALGKAASWQGDKLTIPASAL